MKFVGVLLYVIEEVRGRISTRSAKQCNKASLQIFYLYIEIFLYAHVHNFSIFIQHIIFSLFFFIISQTYYIYHITLFLSLSKYLYVNECTQIIFLAQYIKLKLESHVSIFCTQLCLEYD